ncbi:MAG: rod shape-determining protein MreD [Ignavibacteria bacterium]|nr:rod shape-determining protein MreD [Ignavibacteria bacterium]
MKRFSVYVLLSLFVVVFQALAAHFLVIIDIVPDIVLLWIVYVAIREGQLAASTAGFLLGLVIDLLSGQDGMLGLATLSKTVAGFVAGYFHNESKTVQTLGGSRFIIAVAIVSFVHNGLYFVIFLQGTDIGWWNILFRYGVPTTFYTSVVALLPMFVFARKYLT